MKTQNIWTLREKLACLLISNWNVKLNSNIDRQSSFIVNISIQKRVWSLRSFTLWAYFLQLQLASTSWHIIIFVISILETLQIKSKLFVVLSQKLYRHFPILLENSIQSLSVDDKFMETYHFDTYYNALPFKNNQHLFVYWERIRESFKITPNACLFTDYECVLMLFGISQRVPIERERRRRF